MAELLDNQNEQGDPPLPSGYVAIKKQSQGAPPLPSGYVVKKKESSGSTSQKGAVVSPTKTTTTSTSSDTEPPTRAQAAVALGGPTNFLKEISSIDKNLISKEEEDVVPLLNKKFANYGFTFEETGAGDAMIVKNKKGETINIDLDPWTTAKEEEGAIKLKNFLSSKKLTEGYAVQVFKKSKSEVDENLTEERLLEEKNQTGFLNTLGIGAKAMWNVPGSGLSYINEALGGTKDYFVIDEYKPLQEEKTQAKKELQKEGLPITGDNIQKRAEDIFRINDKRKQLEKRIDANLPEDYDRQGIWKELKLDNLKKNSSLKETIITADVYQSQIKEFEKYHNYFKTIPRDQITQEKVDKYNDLLGNAKESLEGLKYLDKNFSKTLEEVKSSDEMLDLFKYNYNDYEKHLSNIKNFAKGIAGGTVKLMEETARYLDEKTGLDTDVYGWREGNIKMANEVLDEASEDREQYLKYKAKDISNFSDVGSFMAGLGTEQIPVWTTLAIAPELGPVLLGAGTGGEQFRAMEIEESQPFAKKTSFGQKLATSYMYGGAEALFERLGTVSILKNIEKSIAKASNPSRRLIEDGAIQEVSKLGKQFGFNFGLEGGTEYLTAESQIAADRYIAGKEISTQQANERRFESFVAGGLMGGSMTMIGGVWGGIAQKARVYSDNKDIKKTKEILSQIERLSDEIKNNPNLTPEERVISYKKMNELTNQSFDIVSKNANKSKDFSAQETQFLVDINIKQAELKAKLQEIKDSNFSKEQKEIFINELKDEYSKLEEKRNTTLQGGYNKLTELPSSEIIRLKDKAARELMKELNPDGTKTITINDSEINKRAIQLLESETKAPAVEDMSVKAPAEAKPAAEGSIDEARVKRRVENTDLTQAEGSTYYDDVNPIKNGKIGDEVYFSDIDGKKYKTKIKEIVDGNVIFENGKTGDDVSSGTNITAEDAWFAKNHPELTLETKPTEAKAAIESPIELKEGEELVDVKQDKKGNTYTYVAETSEKDGVKTTKFKFNRSDKSSEQRSTAGVDADKVLDKYGYEIPADEIIEGVEIIKINEIREGEKTTGATVTFKDAETGNTFRGEIVLEPKPTEAKAAEVKPTEAKAEVKPGKVKEPAIVVHGAVNGFDLQYSEGIDKKDIVTPKDGRGFLPAEQQKALNEYKSIITKDEVLDNKNKSITIITPSADNFGRSATNTFEFIIPEGNTSTTEGIKSILDNVTKTDLKGKEVINESVKQVKEYIDSNKPTEVKPTEVKAAEVTPTEVKAEEVKPAAEVTPTVTEAKVAIPDQHREEYDRLIKEYEKDLADSKENLKSEKERSFFSRSRSYIKENENDIKFYENQIKLLKENPIEFYKNWIKSVEETHNDSLKDKSKYDDGKTYKERVIENYGTTDFNVVEASFIEDFNKKIADYEAAQKTANENAKLKNTAEVKDIVAPKEDLTAGKGLFSEPVEHVIKTAEGYKKSKGITVDAGERITDIDVENSKKIADAYDEMQSNPNDPEVKAAYNAMANETMDQFKYLIDNGYTVELYDGKTEPYKNSEEMLKDLRDNKHLYVFSTEEGFGDTPITEKDRQENPLLKDSGFTDKNGKKLLINDAFRFVHDIFGHGERGNSFGAKGEENAWDVHSRMYSPEARRAMTTETRGQNSWVNFNKEMRNEDGSIKKKGDKGYLSPTERPFADQKIGLLPEWVSKSIYETAKKPTETTVSEKKIAEATKKLADKVREIKVSRPDIFSSGTPGSLAWDLGVEAVAKSIEITGDIAQAVSDGLEAIKKTDWYKGLDNDKKTVAEEEFRKKFNSLKENIDEQGQQAISNGSTTMKDFFDYMSNNENFNSLTEEQKKDLYYNSVSKYSTSQAVDQAAQAPKLINLKDQSWLKKFIQAFQNKMIRVKDVQDQMEGALGIKILKEANVALKFELLVGKTINIIEDKQKEIFGKSNKDSWANRAKKDGVDIDQIGMYMYALHAEERNLANATEREENFKKEVDALNEKIKNAETQSLKTRYENELKKLISGQGKVKLLKEAGSGMTNEQAQEIIDNVEKSGKKELFDKYAKEFREKVIKPTLDDKLKYGLIDQDLYDKLQTQYKNYVPLQVVEKAMTKRAGGAGAGASVKGKDIFKAKGSDLYKYTDRYNPIFSSMFEYQNTVARGERNQAAQALINLAELDKNNEVFEVHKPKYTAILDSNGDIKYMLPTTSQKLINDSVELKVDGKPVYVEVKDKAMRDALQSQGIQRGIRGLYIVNSWIRSTATLMNPNFLITNFLRDYQSALINIQSEIKDLDIKNVTGKIANPKNLKSAAQGIIQDSKGKYDSEWAKLAKEYRDSGGKVSWFQKETLEEYVDSLRKDIEKINKGEKMYTAALNKLGDTLMLAQSVVEQSIRLSTFKALKDAGVSTEEAARAAKNITVNFENKGTWGGLMDSLYLFATAGLSGTVRMATSLSKSKTARTIAGGMFAYGILEAALNSHLGGDDDDDEKIDDGIKERNFVLVNPKDSKQEPLLLPMAYGLNVFKYAGNLTYDVATGRKDATEATSKMFMTIYNQISPLQGPTLSQAVAPTAFDPFVQHSENKNFFGAPIKPEQPKFGPKKKESDLYFESVRPGSLWTAKKLNEWTGGSAMEKGYIDISPEILDHYYDQLGGGTGKFISDVGYTGKIAAKEVVESIHGKEMKDKDEFSLRRLPFVKAFFGSKPEKKELQYIYETFERSSIEELSKEEVTKFTKQLREAVQSGALDRKDAKRINKSVTEGQDKIFKYKGIQEVKLEDMTEEQKKKSGLEKKLTDAEFRAKYGDRAFKQLLRGRELSKKGAN